MNTCKNNKIEPHVILHLRINQDDINRYLNNKIQTDPSNLITDLEPTPYDSSNIYSMTNTFTLNDTPANVDNQFTFNEVKLENSQNNIISNFQNGKPFPPSLTQHFTDPELKENIESEHFLSISHINIDENPNYPKPTTKKLILLEAIIDTASVLQIDEIINNYSVLACYGTNGLNEEILKAIKNLQELEEVIFFLLRS